MKRVEERIKQLQGEMNRLPLTRDHWHYLFADHFDVTTNRINLPHDDDVIKGAFNQGDGLISRRRLKAGSSADIFDESSALSEKAMFLNNTDVIN